MIKSYDIFTERYGCQWKLIKLCNENIIDSNTLLQRNKIRLGTLWMGWCSMGTSNAYYNLVLTHFWGWPKKRVQTLVLRHRPKAHARRLCNSKLPIPDHAQVKVIWSRLHILMVRSHGIKVPVRCSGCGSHDRSVDCGLCLCNQAIEAPPIKTSRRWIIYAQGWCDFPLVLVRIQWQQDLRLAKTIGSKIAGNWVKVTRRSWL